MDPAIAAVLIVLIVSVAGVVSAVWSARLRDKSVN